MITKTALVFGVGLVLLPGCPLLDVEADVGEVCVTYPDIEVDVPAGSVMLETSFVVDDLSAIHDLTKFDATMSFVRARVRATSGLDDLGFVTSAHLDISSGDPTSALPRITVYTCDGDCTPTGPSLEIPAPDQHDAMDYVKSGSLLVDLQISGRTPAQHFKMDVDVCMSGRAGYTFTP